MALIDTSHPFFRPAWRRYALVIFTGCWTVFEYTLGNTFWVVLFSAITMYLAWVLVLRFEPAETDTNSDDD